MYYGTKGQLFKMYSCYVFLEIDIATVCANGHRYWQIADHNVATTDNGPTVTAVHNTSILY